MGKLAKAFGFGSKGKIYLSVDKPLYTAGELVVGAITVEVNEAIKCDALVLKVSGTEKMTWADVNGNGYKYTPEFFGVKIVIHALPHEYLPGEYAHPFEYQLPPSLPSVFRLDSFQSDFIADMKIAITYQLTATLNVKDLLTSDFKTECNLQVYAQPAMAMPVAEPSTDSIVQNIRFLGFIKKGECELGIRLDKNVFQAGETVNVVCDIDNHSEVDISAVHCYLCQDMHLTPTSRTETFSRKLVKQSFPGVASASMSTQSLPLVLEPTAILPSTTGIRICCSYRIGIECRVSWGRNVRVSVPVTIVAPDKQFISWATPCADGYERANK